MAERATVSQSVSQCPKPMSGGASRCVTSHEDINSHHSRLAIGKEARKSEMESHVWGRLAGSSPDINRKVPQSLS